MDATIKAGDFRICPSCASRNKAAYELLRALQRSVGRGAGRRRLASGARAPPGNPRLMRFVLAAGVHRRHRRRPHRPHGVPAPRWRCPRSPRTSAPTARAPWTLRRRHRDRLVPRRQRSGAPDTAVTSSAARRRAGRASRSPSSARTRTTCPAIPARAWWGSRPARRGPGRRWRRKRVFTDRRPAGDAGGAWSTPGAARQPAARVRRTTTTRRRRRLTDSIALSRRARPVLSVPPCSNGGPCARAWSSSWRARSSTRFTATRTRTSPVTPSGATTPTSRIGTRAASPLETASPSTPASGSRVTRTSCTSCSSPPRS